MTIEGLGKKFQEARLARKLTLDEASRMTKIRPARLAEIEADDFSQFPSLAYAKGFILIYGKFLDVDVTPYMEAFEGSEAVTVDGYSYLQDNPAPKPARTRVVPHRFSSSSSERGPTSLMPLVIGIILLIIGFTVMRFIMNIQRIAPRKGESAPLTQTSVSPPAATPVVAVTPVSVIATPTPSAAAQATKEPSTSAAVQATKAPATSSPAVAQTTKPAATPPAGPPPASVVPTAPKVAAASAAPSAAAPEPEVRRAEPVRPEDIAKAATANESAGPNKVAIRPLKKTYIKVVVDNEASTPAFERWISPNDKPVEFRGQHFTVRVLDRDAVQIKKNGKPVAEDDSDVTIE
jgi:cytoskeletal protein RodZ